MVSNSVYAPFWTYREEKMDKALLFVLFQNSLLMD